MTKWYRPKWDSLPNLKGNSPRSGTDAAPSLWIITPECILYTTKLMIPLSKQLPPSMLLRSLPPSTAFAFATTTGTTGASMATPSRNHERRVIRDLPSAGLTLTSKMGLRSAQFGIFRRARESNCYMLALVGQLPCTLPYGHTPFGMPFYFTTVCRCWRMGHQGWSFLAPFVLGAI